MPHFRRIWTKFTTSEDIQAMPDDTTRLAWALLPTALDREGRGLYNGAWLRARVFPLREDIENSQARAMLDWWADHGMILRYTVAKREYFLLPTWGAYQGDCTKEAVSEIPDPPPELLQTYSGVTPDLLQRGVGTEAKAKAKAEAEAEAEAEAKAEAEAEAPTEAERVAAALSALSALPLREPISETGRKRLALQPFMTPQYIDAVHRRWKKKPGSGVGLLITMLASGEVPKGNGGSPGELATTEDRRAYYASEGVVT